MNARILILARLVAMAGLLTLLMSSYVLRSEVIDLSAMHLDADAAKARNDLDRHQESYADRVAEFAMEQEDYTIRLQHYRDMLELYRTDYDAYVQRLDDAFRPPSPPTRPLPPQSPALKAELYEINTRFRERRAQYFHRLAVLNGVAAGASLATVGGLVFLLLFDERGRWWIYLALLSLSFVFLIGPAFHAMLTGLMGALRAPPIF
ncbi:MAG: hypothetical protein H6739_09455 [Alphaproteobacteria bacterium]|nr:hypothetical protein [Alphaproteobacteria bacterium]